MKKLLLGLLFGTTMVASSFGQFNRPILTTSVNENKIYFHDTSGYSMALIDSMSISTLGGDTVLGLHGVATDPTTGDMYLIADVSDENDRVILHLDINTWETTRLSTVIADNYFAALEFGSDNELYVMPGNNTSINHKLYQLDKISGDTVRGLSIMHTFQAGKSMASCPDNGLMYHYINGGFESINLYDSTNVDITFTGGSNDAAGLEYIGNGEFLLITWSGEIHTIDTSGVISNYGSGPFYQDRGFAFPSWSIYTSDPTTFCDGDSANLYANLADSYEWLLDGITIPGATDSVYTALTTGDYQCVLTDASSNNDTSQVMTITALNIPNVTLNSAASYYCSGDSVQLTGSNGGTSQWYLDGNPISGANSNTYYAMNDGWYNMTKTNTNGCTDSAAVGLAITQAPLTTITPSEISGVSCNGYTDGVADVTVTGGPSSAYIYLWSNGETTNTASGLSTSSSVTVTSGNCSSIKVVTISEPIVLSASTSMTSTSGCGSTDGTATAMATGGPTTYTYLWENGGTNATTTGLGFGIQNVTISSGSCSITSSANITEAAGVTVTAGVTNDAACYGGTDGSATVNSTGGPTTIYSYTWNNGQSSSTATGLSAGNQNVTVSNGGCSTIFSITISEPNEIEDVSVSISNSSAECGDLITVTLANSEIGVDYYLRDNSNDSCILHMAGSGAQSSFDNLYVDQTTSYNVLGRVAPAPEMGTGNGLAFDGADDFVQSSGNVTIDETFTIEAMVNLNDPTPFLSGIVAFNSGTGSGTWVTLNLDIASGGRLWLEMDLLGNWTGTTVVNDNAWHHVAVTYDGLNVNFYVDGVPDGTFPVSASFTNSRPVLIGVDRSASAFFNQGEIDEVKIWDHSMSPAEITASMNKCLLGCESELRLYYQMEDGSGSGIVTDLTGNGNDGNLTNMDVNTSWVTAYGCGNGCEVEMSSNPSISITPSTLSASIVCNPTSGIGNSDGSSSVTATGGSSSYSYLWDNGETNSTITGQPASTVIVSVNDNSYCPLITATCSIIDDPCAAITATISSNDVSCNGADDGDATATMVGGASSSFTYVWEDMSTDMMRTGLTPGTYSVTITDGFSCIDSSMVTISEPSALTVSVSGVDPTCTNAGTDGTVMATAIGGPSTTYTYLWDNSTTTDSQTGLTNGTYIVTISSGVCSEVDSVMLSPAAAANYTVTAAICAGDTLFVGGANQTTAGAYVDSLSSVNGCDSVITTNLTVNTPPSLQVVADPAIICQGETTDLTAIASGVGISYIWDNASLLDNNAIAFPVATPTDTTVFTVTATQNGCSSSGSITVSVIESPMITVTESPNLTACKDTLTIETTTAINYIWDTPYGTQTTTQTEIIVLIVDISQAYIVTGYDQYGCASSTETVNVAGSLSCSPIGIDETNSMNGFELFPNPNNGSFAINFSDEGNHSVKLVDVTGKVVYQNLVKSTTTSIDVDLVSGIYFVEVTTNGTTTVEKLIIN